MLLWMGLIFVMSHQDGTTSSKTSEWVLSLLRWLNIDYETLKGYNLRFYVRKLAHMTEYFILYLLSYRLLRQYYAPSQALWWSLLLTIGYAGTDEFHQTFIPGRVGTIVDVGIDSMGAGLALLLTFLLGRRKKAIDTKKM